MTAPAMSLDRGRIVVADDDDDHRTLLATWLTQHGYSVVRAHDGQELLEILFGVPAYYFAAVVCDQRMPGLHGTECLARASSRTHFVIVTGSSDPLVEWAAIRFGALAFLQKPIDMQRLLDVLNAASERGPGDARRSGTRRPVPYDPDE